MSVPTISSTIDDESRKSPFRHSLQPKSQSEVAVVLPVRRHHSLGKNRTTNYIKKPSVPDIPEVEKSEDDEAPNLGKQDVAAPENVRISFTKKTRKSSNISRTSKTSIQSAASNMERGFVNYGYDQSTSTSLHGSMTSLPVIREQYCCCARWTKLEKHLALIVAILALIIVGLVIAIGLVANHDSDNPKRFPLLLKL